MPQSKAGTLFIGDVTPENLDTLDSSDNQFLDGGDTHVDPVNGRDLLVDFSGFEGDVATTETLRLLGTTAVSLSDIEV